MQQPLRPYNRFFRASDLFTRELAYNADRFIIYNYVFLVIIHVVLCLLLGLNTKFN